MVNSPDELVIKGLLTLENLGLEIENILNKKVSFGLRVDKLKHLEEFFTQTRWVLKGDLVLLAVIYH